MTLFLGTLILHLLFVIVTSDSFCNITSYYASVPEVFEGMPTNRSSWLSLIDKLHILLESTHNTIPYTSVDADVWDALRVLDQDPLNKSNVWLLYANRTEPFATNGLPSGWNREHLIPRSYGLGESGPDFSDLYNLRAVDSNVNSARSNLYYDNCFPSEDLSCDQPAHIEAGGDTAKNSRYFMPPAKDRGDLARSVFYMALRYIGSSSNTENIVLGDCPCIGDHTFGNLSTLLAWAEMDDVSYGERRRNNLTCVLFQRNRNPFVDFSWLKQVFLVKPFISSLQKSCAPTYTGDPDNCGDDYSVSPSSYPTSFTYPDITAGEIAFIGFNTDNPDSFALVALNAINAGTKVYVTDKGFDGTEFRSGEGIWQFLATSYMPKGTVWSYEEESSTSDHFGIWSTVEGNPLLSMSGDQLFVFIASNYYQPSFLFGVSNAWEGQGAELTAQTSLLPNELNASGAFLTIGSANNGKYVGPTVGTRDELLQNISDLSNWHMSTSTTFSLNFQNFTVLETKSNKTCLPISSGRIM